MSVTIKLLAPFLLLLGFSVKAENVERQEFKNLLLALSYQSQITALDCQESYNGKAATFVQYIFKLTDDPAYVGAFNMLFTRPADGHQWSTLVAYEGYRGFVMGVLNMSRDGDKVEYNHEFHGYFEDIIDLRTNLGHVTILTYSKVNSTGVQYELNCPIP